MYLIGIDLGTSGTKTVLFDEDGNAIKSCTVEYPMYQPQNGWAEQEPEDWYNAAVETLKNVTEGIEPSEIAGIGISGQMHGLVMLADSFGAPVKTVTSKEGPAPGAAILAGVGAGIYPSVREACGRVVKTNTIQEPKPENTHKYSEMHRIYKSLYPHLKGVYKELAAI